MAKAAQNERPRLVVGISGASGIIYGLRMLDAARELGVETHLVMSRAAALTLAQETSLSMADAQAIDHAGGAGDAHHQPRPLGLRHAERS